MFFSKINETKHNTIITGSSSGRYAYKSIPISRHAEIDVLKKEKKNYSLTKKIRKFNLIVIKISKTGNISTARPCYHCIKQLESASFVRIKNIFYSNKEGNIIKETFEQLIKSVYDGTAIISSGYRMRMGLTSKQSKDFLLRKEKTIS